MRKTLDWDPYFEIAKRDAPWRERLTEYAQLARQHFESSRFDEFCAQHLAHLDEVSYEFFGSTEARDAVRQKVAALYPTHEIEPFTNMFFERIQKWRAAEGRAAA
jgi:hypothetical protein